MGDGQASQSNRTQPLGPDALELSPQQVRDLRDQDADLVLLDCRTPDEHAVARIEGAMLMPMHEVAAHVEQLRRYAGRRMVVYCHHGVRSLRVVHWLREQGFAGACSMSGGLERWSQEIDPTVPRY